MENSKPHHAGSQSSFTGVDVDQLIDASACKEFYMALEECLVQTNRSWKKCQKEVKLLKECNYNGKTRDGTH
eukprot:CAMPEP_0185018406 /NCGR_PEP_ID=MMETSP1103-20130426/1143_1 /TAXON_ID=36769 /ORGANISM="Paraphysomonas bandaiensis, Strain Caron Lab Isolate" /LENGTH=71 /DNA_ID=CAMNT_0027548207 /DNA_START=34 /DNA_END=249 /DNA_ORIENTATION=+